MGDDVDRLPGRGDLRGHALKLVLLDRDGVLNEDRADYVKTPAELAMIDGSAAAVKRFNDAGLKVALVTNQSAVGRGIVTEAMLARIHEALREALSREGARLDAVHVCTDRPDAATSRRKPGPGMLIEAMTNFGLGPRDTVMIGDDRRDLEAAKAAGCARILVRTGKGARTQADGIPHALLPVAVYDRLIDAADALLGAADDRTDGAPKGPLGNAP